MHLNRRNFATFSEEERKIHQNLRGKFSSENFQNRNRLAGKSAPKNQCQFGGSSASLAWVTSSATGHCQPARENAGSGGGTAVHSGGSAAACIALSAQHSLALECRCSSPSHRLSRFLLSFTSNSLSTSSHHAHQRR